MKHQLSALEGPHIVELFAPWIAGDDARVGYSHYYREMGVVAVSAIPESAALCVVRRNNGLLTVWTRSGTSGKHASKARGLLIHQLRLHRQASFALNTTAVFWLLMDGEKAIGTSLWAVDHGDGTIPMDEVRILAEEWGMLSVAQTTYVAEDGFRLFTQKVLENPAVSAGRWCVEFYSGKRVLVVKR